MVDEIVEGAEGEGEEARRKHYLEAARVAESVRALAVELVKPGKRFLEVVEAIETEIIAAKARPAFPVNVSLNENAAHYTPKASDESVFSEKDVVKIDFGVHVNGFIVDTAFTVDLSGENAALVEASEAALENALAVMRAGRKVSEVGAVIQKIIEKKGFKPIENLCGHSLSEFLLHSGQEIPNTERGNYVLKEGDVFAVEPFATTGGGRVVEGTFCEIYSLVNLRNVRLPQSRKLLEVVSKEFQTLPFAKRWLSKAFSAPSIELALNDLIRQEILEPYPLLREINKGLVSQAESTVIVEKEGVKVLV